MSAPGIKQLLRNIGWLMAAEGAARATRLATALALAYALTPAMFGAAALIMTIAEIMRTPTRNGVLQAVVRAEDRDLPAVAATARRVNWIVHLALAALQALAAWPLAQLYGAPGIVGPLLVCALIFPLYPVAFGRISLLHRAGRMDQVGRVMGLTVSVGNLLTAALALLGFELWSVAIPRVVSAALWVVMARRLGPEPPAPGPDERADWRAIWRYGKSILGAELLKTARLQGDKLIVGKVLGLEALGVYAFAFNAGLGLSQSLLTGFSNALFPHLCAAGRGGDMLRAAGQAMRGALAAAAVLFGAQAILAPWYVPLAFGARWEPAVAPLAILCLSAITRPLWESASQLLRAAGAPQAELGWSLAVTGVLFAAVALGASLGGVIGAATAYFIVHVIADPSFAAWAFGRIRRAPALVAAE